MIIHSFTQTCLVVKMLHYHPQEMEHMPPKQANALLNKLLGFLSKSTPTIFSKATTTTTKSCLLNVKVCTRYVSSAVTNEKRTEDGVSKALNIKLP